MSIVIQGDALHLPIPDESIDAIVTDPPYGLGFMGKEWDHFDSRNFDEVELVKRGATRGLDHTRGRLRSPSMHAGEYDFGRNNEFQTWCELWALEAFRVLKPGAHLLAFGGTRTYHRLVSGIEDAGFEIRDSILWLFGSGFPKSRNLDGEWEGWGTALKPAHEPIVVARKPLSEGTVQANMEAHGTGALNIEASRIGFSSEADERESKSKNRHADFGSGARRNQVYNHDGRDRADAGNYEASGRWPANVVLDEHAAAELDRQTGALPRGIASPRSPGLSGPVFGKGKGEGYPGGYDDQGGASRFFYVAKASRAEREHGLEGIAEGTNREVRNHHPTVKPVALMRHLVGLVAPKGALVLDPFAGSGTTLMACRQLGRRSIGIERNADYCEIARRRVAAALDPIRAPARPTEAVAGQESLL